MIKTGSDFSGVGAFDQALYRLGIVQDKQFACDMDKYARQTYCLNFGTEKDIELSKIGKPDNLTVALAKKIPELRSKLKTAINAKDFSFYYPENVYDREIPKESLDIYMTSPPCQSFSLAGKRKGEDSKNGVLFYNSHEFISVNKPRYFIFENVKGLLSDDGGKTFQRWIDYLGGKTINGNPVIFPHEKSVPYHVYYQVMNAKHYGVPQNRERIFIIGIRDDSDNEFSFPKPFHLVKRLKDVLESEVDEKYFLSDTMLKWIDSHREKRQSSGKYPFTEEDDYSGCITARYNKMGAEDIFIGSVKIPTNNSKGYDIAEEEEDSINFSNPNSETRRGRVGKGVAQTLDTSCNQGVLVKNNLEGKVFELRNDEGIREFEGDVCGTIRTIDSGGDKHTMQNQRIRRLLPIECFRLMDFNEDFKWDVSDSQAYKQAGNSIVVSCLVEIISKLKL